jgi:hypothetical protein
VTGERVTIQVWADERPGFTIEHVAEP